MIVVDNLTKRCGKKIDIDGLTFAVQPGMATGFLGPNGSGKTTTIASSPRIARQWRQRPAWRGQALHSIGIAAQFVSRSSGRRGRARCCRWVISGSANLRLRSCL